jgi:hypothetical protein
MSFLFGIFSLDIFLLHSEFLLREQCFPFVVLACVICTVQCADDFLVNDNNMCAGRCPAIG